MRLRHRGLRAAASQAASQHELSLPTVRRLEAISKSAGSVLSLPAEIEGQYRSEWRITANHIRTLLSLIPTLIFGIIPFWAEWFLGVSDELSLLLRAVAYGIVLPCSLVAAASCWLQPHRPASSAIITIAGLLIVVAIEYLRAECARRGVDFDHSLAVAVPVGLCVLGGFRFVRVLMIVAAYFIVVLVCEYWMDSHLRTPSMWLGEICLAGLSAVAALWMETTRRRSWATRRLLQIQAYQDPLTGLRNRRSFEQHFETAAAQARREQKTIVFALADLDYFKRINDSYGHDFGDGVLAEVGVLFGQFGRRPLDVVARLGGEEFAVLLYDCNEDDGRRLLEGLVAEVAGLAIGNVDSPLGILTTSIGGVVSDGSLPMSELYHSADTHLYAVKKRGRNAARVGPLFS
ncbi:MAG TPA: GGDEF domain-containing protein [Fontimonas sp.]